MFLSTIRFSTGTFIGRQQQKKITQILKNLIDLPQSSQFLHPVPWEEYDLDDYLDIIKHPMNLLKVQQDFQNKKFENVEEVLDHIQLIWDNCKMYNTEGYFYEIAEKMQKAFRKMIKNYLPTIQILSNVPAKNSTSNKKPNIQPVKQITRGATSSRNTNNKISNQKNQKMEEPESSSFEQQKQISKEQKKPEIEQIPFNQKIKFYQRLKQITQQQLTQIVVLIQQSCSEGFKTLGGGRYQILTDNFDSEIFKKLNEKVNEFIENEKLSNISGSKKIKI